MIVYVGRAPARAGNRSTIRIPANAYMCSDSRYVQLLVLHERHWPALCRVLRREDWLEHHQWHQVAALIFRLMGLCFGAGWIVGGRNALTFRRPVGVSDFCVARGIVRSKTPEGDHHIRVTCEVWVENQPGEKAIVGTCSGLVER